ncbi:MAG: SGNH/GDSL hydrolase family protein [Clostridia bacterium]|nr:SGNH/GDSL hydrolase family protein [Clostridia bacterium]
MDWNNELYNNEEKPLDRLVDGYSHTSVFRTIAFVGDSLSSGEFETRDAEGKPGYHDLFEYSWGQYIARKNGLKAYNFSRGGMTAVEYIESFAEQKGFWKKELAAQAYVIALGVNDLCGRKMEVGSVDDIDADDHRKNKPTFLGYYAAIVSRYKEISPDAKFFFVTFPKHGNAERDEKAQEMIKALYLLSEYFENSYVIDLYKYGPVYDDAFKEKFYMFGHMNPSGYILTAKMIDSYIDYIVRRNYNDFKTVGFVGTDIDYKSGLIK